MLLKEINNEIENFRYKNVQIVPGLFFNQYDTLQKIFFYFNSKFKTGEIDEDGDRKYFENIVKNPCKIFSKSVDFDTKNIHLLTAGGGDPLKTWFMQRDLGYWMRDKQFGKVLNRIFYELPIFGTVVLKIIKGQPYFVDLRNFIVQQSADSLDGSSYIIEVHNFTVSQFKKAAKVMGWPQDKVEEAIAEFNRMRDTTHIRVFERYGDVPNVTDNGVTTYENRRVFLADVGIDEYDNVGNLLTVRPGVELDSQVWEGNPYREIHGGEKIPGRWLAVGIVEALFEPQIRINEIANVQAKTTYWAGLRVFQSRDAAVTRNLYTDVKNGEVMNSDSEITQIDMSDRNLAFFNDEHAKWTKNIEDLTVAFAPVGHSVIAIQVALDQVVSYFEQIQENIAMDIKEILFEDVIPYFEDDSTPEHTLRLVGQDLDQYIQMIKNDLVLKQMIKQAVSDGKFPTSEDASVAGLAIEAAIKQNKEHILTIPKGFYKDVKYDVDIDITGESVDTKARSAVRLSILQAITADPTMTTDPVKKKFLIGMAEDGGLNPADLFDSTPSDPNSAMIPTVTPGRAGGGVSAPVPGAPAQNKTLSRV